MGRRKLTGLLLWACLGLAACQDAPQAPEREVPWALLQQPAEQQAGRRLFARHCRECHGTSAEGRSPRAARFVPPAPDFLSAVYRQADPAYLFWRIARGKQVEPYRSRGSVMPAWDPHLSERQIWQLVAYLQQRAGSG